MRFDRNDTAGCALQLVLPNANVTSRPDKVDCHQGSASHLQRVQDDVNAQTSLLYTGLSGSQVFWGDR